ncbi:MAG: hypothetical protein AB7D07_16020 [Desulfovibrionaceae bacterium]
MNFKKISFGYASAEKERSEEPELILNGYIDYKAATEAAKSGAKHLFLGYKGAGKSLIGERLELTLHDDSTQFVKVVSLQDFPFTPFSKIIRGDAEPEVKYPSAWSWILLVYLLDSFSKDEGLTHPDPAIFQDAISAFKAMGLSPAGDPAKIIRTSAKKSFQLALPGKLATYTWSGSETKPASELPDYVESLKTLISQARSASRHYLIIDGLDDILTTREIQYKSLSALIFEVARLNKQFASFGCPANIIVLCRTDLFERIPGANKNKIRQDDAIELDWYHDPYEPYASLLVQIAQLRSARSLGPTINLFNDLLPASVDGIETVRYLLDATRHTPRDFLRLLTHIQEFASEGRIRASQLKSGLREYSIKYFMPEIKDELSGYATSEEISCMIAALSRLRKRDFKISELIAESGSRIKSLSPEKICDMCEALFNCSGIGNIQHRPVGTTFYTFKYRNRHSSFNENEDIILHKGLWKSLNLT